MLDELRLRVQELNQNRATFDAFLAQLDDARWNQPVGAEKYTARQTMAHLAGAVKTMTRMGQNWVAGKDNTLRPDFDLNFFNARQQEKRAQMSNVELVQEWHDGQQGVIAFMETLGAADLEKCGEHPTAKQIAVRDLFLIITTHEADHIRQVMDAFAK
ncbi:MAG: DinB family protein [Chloroflexi bacterium]|nr:DinB family protein [Chloroflexota bacterium]